MTHSIRLARVLDEIESEHQAWCDLVGRLRVEPSQDHSSGHGQWTVTETLIHVTAWQEIALRIARDQARPDAPVIDAQRGPGAALGIDTDAFNAELLVTHRTWTSEQALAWSDQIHAELRAALVALPDDRLFGDSGSGRLLRWLALPAIQHPREHREEVEQYILD